MFPEDFDKLDALAQYQVLQTADTWVIEFPVKTSATMQAYEETLKEQFDRYIMFMEKYADHNVSISIYVGEDEWDEMAQLIHDNWNSYVSLSMLPKLTGAYKLIPYEPIDEAEYNRRVAEDYGDFEQILIDITSHNVDGDDLMDAACASGACPVR